MIRPTRVAMFVCGVFLAAAPKMAHGQVEPSDLRFEVASVRPNRAVDAQPRLDMAGGRFIAINVTAWELIKMAYPAGSRERGDDQVDGGPRWVQTDRFDIMATGGPVTVARPAAGSVAPSLGVGIDQLRVMLRNLLAERFMLRVRHEQRELPVYALTRVNPDRFGSQLRQSGADCTTEPAPPAADRAACGGFRLGGGRLLGHAVTMSALVSLLSGLPVLGRPVEDRTTLVGTFDIEASWIREPAPSAQAEPAAPGPSIFTAFQEQLGLRLEATRGPVDVVVIERIARPTEN